MVEGFRVFGGLGVVLFLFFSGFRVEGQPQGPQTLIAQNPLNTQTLRIKNP